MAEHSLDRTAWSALTGRHADVALVWGRARRYEPAYGVFAAVADRDEASLADLGALVAAHGDLALLDPDPPIVPGTRIVSQEAGVQMVALQLIAPPSPALDAVQLGDADAGEMLALATLTEPGPFFALTHRLGEFFGVKENGRLVAMAGERMKPDGFTEVSGVCTHPDARGRGYAAALTSLVAHRIAARGETPFLHSYADNFGAIALYEKLGFTMRTELLMTRLTPA